MEYPCWVPIYYAPRDTVWLAISISLFRPPGCFSDPATYYYNFIHLDFGNSVLPPALYLGPVILMAITESSNNVLSYCQPWVIEESHHWTCCVASQQNIVYGFGKWCILQAFSWDIIIWWGSWPSKVYLLQHAGFYGFLNLMVYCLLWNCGISMSLSIGHCFSMSLRASQ